MNYKIISLVLFLFPLSFLSSQNLNIKSLRAYSSQDETLIPIISEEGGMIIEFDVESEFKPSLNIVFRFCDKDWNPTDNIFLANIGKNIAHFLDLETLPVSVENAKYHFEGEFPGNYPDIEFPFSGKWMFYVTESNDTSIIYGKGKFYAIQNDIKMNVTLKREQLEDKVYSPADLAKVFNVTAAFNVPDEMFPLYVDHLEIIENQKIYQPYIVDRNFNTNTRQFYWDGNRKLSFTARDIYPVKEYRQADFRNTNKFNSKDVNAQFDGIEYSRFYKAARQDINGGSILTNYNNAFATYLNVTFSIRPPDENTGAIFLVGAFNNWQVLPEYQLTNSYGLYSKTIELKRGVYDYQYVVADVINNVIKNDDWLYLEGNTWETSNVYHLFLYYKDPNYGGYDRIIGYAKIISR